MAIRFTYHSGNLSTDIEEKAKKWIAEVIKRHGRSVGSISYLFSTDDFVLEANQHYLNHDTFTDIITFDYVAGNLISGDILISVDRVGENAKQFNVPYQQELLRVVIHGIHHLLGQGDKTDTEALEMRKKEEESLRLWNEMFHEEQHT